MEKALELGYFETPRQITLKDLAAEMDISHQALSERLRRGMRSVAAAIVSADPDEETQLWTGSQAHRAENVHQNPNCSKLSGSALKVRQIDQDTADYHDLTPCPICSEARSFSIPETAVSGD